MVAQPQTQTEQSEQDMFELWRVLSDEHRQIVLQVAQAFALVDQQDLTSNEPPTEVIIDDEETRRTEQIRRNQGAIVLLQSWQEEAAALTPEERAQGEIEFEDFKRAMNENRKPGPPLYL